MGRAEEARDYFEQLLACRNRLGMMSEDIDIETGEQWGNYPQTYSMVGIINCAMRLSRSWEKAMKRLVVVSNRVVNPECQAAGGLAVCILDGLRAGGIWFGWNGEIVADESGR